MKNSKDFLLLGHNGYLGDYLLHSIDADILDAKEIYNNGIKYNFVINCIGKPDIDFCEQNFEESLYSNSNIILDIKKFYPESKIINFSSYYVYNEKGFCSETSITTDCTNYAKHKLLSEKNNYDGINFRLGKLFGNKRKIKNKLFDLILNSNELYLDEILFNPVSVKLVSKILKNTSFLNNHSGIYNLSNIGYVSHYDYGKYIANYLDLDISINKRKNFEKPFCNHGNFLMSVKKLSKYFDIEHWTYDMNQFLDEYKDNF